MVSEEDRVQDANAIAKRAPRWSGEGEASASSMTKRAIMHELLTRQSSLSYRQSETIVNAMFEAMAAALARGDRIEVRGFGTFGVKPRDARKGRNPKTGEAVEVEAKKVPFFRAGKELRIEINGADPEGR